MSPILNIELAAEHRTDLLRAAEVRRRAVAATGHHRSLLARLADRAQELSVRLRRPIATAASAAGSTATVCCA